MRASAASAAFNTRCAKIAFTPMPLVLTVSARMFGCNWRRVFSISAR